MPPAEPALWLRGVRAGYGRTEVLHGVELAVPEGAVVALLGPNGAGKSTALRVAAGQVAPTAGCVHLAGAHVNGLPADVRARAGVALVPEGRGVFPNLTVAENLRVASLAAAPGADVAARAFDRFPALAERGDQLAGTLSGGQQQLLAMARALATDPAVLLLDEISMGLAPRVAAQLYEVVGEAAAGGVAVLVVEQHARAALAVADHVVVLAQGAVRLAGEPPDMAGELVSAYLGGGG